MTANPPSHRAITYKLAANIRQKFIRSVIECYNQNSPYWELTFGITHYRNDIELGIDGC